MCVKASRKDKWFTFATTKQLCDIQLFYSNYIPYRVGWTIYGFLLLQPMKECTMQIIKIELESVLMID